MFVDHAGQGTSRPSAGWVRSVPARSWRGVQAVVPFVPLLSYNAALWALIRDRSRFPSSDDYPFVAELEQNWALVQAELDELLDHGPPIPRFETLEPQQAQLWRNVSRFLGRVRGPRRAPIPAGRPVGWTPVLSPT